MGNDLLFSAGRIKSVEKKLLSAERILRILDANDLDSAVKVLYEYGYGGGINVENAFKYQDILNAEEHIFNKFIMEIIPEKLSFEVLLTEQDFYLAKVFAKEKYFSSKIDLTNINDGFLFKKDKISEIISFNDYDSLPIELKEAFLSFDELFKKNQLLPSYVDVTIDKALYRYVARVTKYNLKADVIKKYYSLKADAKNILTFFRAKKSRFNEQSFSFVLMPTGKIDVESLINVYNEDFISFSKLVKDTVFENAINKCKDDIANDNFVELEKRLDYVLTSYIATYKNDLFSVGCVINYYLTKANELKNIKIILTGIKNNIDKQEVKKRLRGIYV